MKKNELVSYMAKRLSIEKAETFSDIKRQLRKKFCENNVSLEQLQEEKKWFFLQKITLENAATETMTPTNLSAFAVVLTLFSTFFAWLLNTNDDAWTIVSLLVYYTFVSIVMGFLIFFHQKKTMQKAKEIAYCTFSLEVIEEIIAEKLKNKNCPKCNGQMIESYENGIFPFYRDDGSCTAIETKKYMCTKCGIIEEYAENPIFQDNK